MRGYRCLKHLRPVIATLIIILLIINSAPVQAILIDIQKDISELSIVNNTINFTASIDIEPAGPTVYADVVPFSNISINITGVSNVECVFFLNGTKISGCTNFDIYPLTLGYNESYDSVRHTSGYGFDPAAQSTFQNTTEFFSAGYGYSYLSGYSLFIDIGPEFKYNITWNSSAEGMGTGNYTANFHIYTYDGTKDQVFIDNDPVNFSIDVGLPQLNLTYPLNITYNLTYDNMIFNVTIDGIDDSSTTMNCNYTLNSVNYTLNSSVLNNTITLVNVTAITNNSFNNHAVNVTCKDSVGNLNSTPTKYFTAQGVRPNITIISPTNTTYSYPQPTLTFKATDDNSSLINCNYTMNTTEFTIGNVTNGIENSLTLPAPGNGQHSIYLYCRDLNAFDAYSSVTYFSVNYTAPAVTTSSVTVSYSVIQEAQSASSIPANTPTAINFSTFESVLLRSMLVTTNSTVENVRVTVQKLDAKPSLTSAITGNVYSYLNMIPINITDSNITNVTINFEVNKSWYSSNGYDYLKTRLRRYSNNEWKILDTTLSGSTSTKYYFDAVSPGLSYFAITVVPENETQTTNQTAATPSAETNESISIIPSEQKETTTEPVGEDITGNVINGEEVSTTDEDGGGGLSLVNLLLIVVGIAVLAGGAVLVYLFRDKIFKKAPKVMAQPIPGMPGIPQMPQMPQMPKPPVMPEQTTAQATKQSQPIARKKIDMEQYAKELLAYAQRLEQMRTTPQKMREIQAYAKQIREYAQSFLDKQVTEQESVDEAGFDTGNLKLAKQEFRDEQKSIEKEINEHLKKRKKEVDEDDFEELDEDEWEEEPSEEEIEELEKEESKEKEEFEREEKEESEEEKSLEEETLEKDKSKESQNKKSGTKKSDEDKKIEEKKR